MLCLFYTDPILNNVQDITENDKIHVHNLEHDFSQITNNYDVFLNNEPAISLSSQIDIGDHHGIYDILYLTYIQLYVNCRFFIFILVMNKTTNLLNMEELSEENNFGLALAERPSVINQGKCSCITQYIYF